MLNITISEQAGSLPPSSETLTMLPVPRQNVVSNQCLIVQTAMSHRLYGIELHLQ